ncbi:MAG: acetyl-CoA synthase subunit gamma, partial [Actinobacteria bacterium]|nr:acetyl-CoA synthase subunit gamma [Actinomycetota bacterium]
LQFADRLGAFKARVGINRMHYQVQPGLYAVGSPTPDSPVLVSANYKLSFDRLRNSLAGRDGWIMVLDTKGINVWCAAGKGTFGTEEIIHRLKATRLWEVVSHRSLILPQLAASGVAAHKVRKISGFRVLYGPVRAEDLPAFLDAGMKATPEMRRVTFTLPERLVLIPIELVVGAKYILVFLAAVFFLAGLGREGYSFDDVTTAGSLAVLLCVLGFIGGAVVAPVLLPWLPGRAFSIKGALVGLAVGLIYAWFSLQNWSSLAGRLDLLAWFLILPAVAAFFAMNFTGASTYTSLSGVKREMRFALPAQIAAGTIGLGLWVTSNFV